jgi:hypothetical protein
VVAKVSGQLVGVRRSFSCLDNGSCEHFVEFCSCLHWSAWTLISLILNGRKSMFGCCSDRRHQICYLKGDEEHSVNLKVFPAHLPDGRIFFYKEQDDWHRRDWRCARMHVLNDGKAIHRRNMSVQYRRSCRPATCYTDFGPTKGSSGRNTSECLESQMMSWSSLRLCQISFLPKTPRGTQQGEA